jgi:hypothetical protein
MDADDLDLFRRSLRSATEQHTGAALDAALDDLGWSDALAADPRIAVSQLFELQGAANADSSALDQVVRGALGVDDEVAIVLPQLGSRTPPGALDGGLFTVVGLGSHAFASHDRALVVARSGGTDVAIVVSVGDLEVRPVEGIDPRLGLVEITADATRLDTPSPTTSAWTAAEGRAQVALGHELVGASRTMLTLAREHALERVQFGQPIAMFQAVRHRLAETLVAIETAEAVLDAAWLDGSPGTAAMAKALAGRAARTTARHCQQVLAGIGFTTEHDLHLFIRRVLVLDEVFGSSRGLTRQLGEQLLDTRQLPPLLPL